MKVEGVMSQDVRGCSPSDSLTDAAMIMWSRDCGFVPVVESHNGRLSGVITDRDICIATATKHRSVDSIQVGEVMSKQPMTCAPTDDVHTAIDRMVQGQVRRLPVVDKNGKLAGVLSLNDLALAAEKSDRRADGVTFADVVRALKAVSTHRLPAAVASA